ncbi:MAG: response regulator [Sandaracinaceae bacterium]|nr:MAG: response regulator [Sandaracinaceae bacterium]
MSDGEEGRREVWVVEDDRALLQGLLTLIRDRGHRARGFSDPRRALKEALARPPKVLITDYQMPGLDGVELAKTLREKLGPKVPRIFLVSGSRMRRVELTQFDQVLRKPFRFVDLLAMVERALEGPRRRRSGQRLRAVDRADREAFESRSKRRAASEE